MPVPTITSPDKRSSTLSFLLHRLTDPLRIGVQKDIGRVEVDYRGQCLLVDSVNDLPAYIQDYWNLGLLASNGVTIQLEEVDLVLLAGDKMKEAILWVYPTQIK